MPKVSHVMLRPYPKVVQIWTAGVAIQISNLDDQLVRFVATFGRIFGVKRAVLHPYTFKFWCPNPIGTDVIWLATNILHIWTSKFENESKHNQQTRLWRNIYGFRQEKSIQIRKWPHLRKPNFRLETTAPHQNIKKKWIHFFEFWWLLDLDVTYTLWTKRCQKL